MEWLDDSEQRIYRVFSRMSRDLFNRFDCDLKQGAGIPRSYYEILFVLGEAPGHRLRMNDLAAGTRSAPSRITYAVSRLERDGLVRREICAGDRRGWTVELTGPGLATLHRAAQLHAQGVRSYLLQALTPGQHEELRRISTKVLARLDGALPPAEREDSPAAR
jgi:DNA-binding MarR family transcriptional regulator